MAASHFRGRLTTRLLGRHVSMTRRRQSPLTDTTISTGSAEQLALPAPALNRRRTPVFFVVLCFSSSGFAFRRESLDGSSSSRVSTFLCCLA